MLSRVAQGTLKGNGAVGPLGLPARLAILRAKEIDRGEIAADLFHELPSVVLLEHGSRFHDAAQDPLKSSARRTPLRAEGLQSAGNGRPTAR